MYKYVCEPVSSEKVTRFEQIHQSTSKSNVISCFLKNIQHLTWYRQYIYYFQLITNTYFKYKDIEYKNLITDNVVLIYF